MAAAIHAHPVQVFPVVGLKWTIAVAIQDTLSKSSLW